MSSFNARGAKDKQDAVGTTLSECHVLCICETWLRESDRGRCDWMSKRVNTNITHIRRKGFERVGFVVQPLLRYKNIGAVSTDRYQCPTTRVREMDITILYLSSATRKKDEEVVYQYIARTDISKSIVIGEFKARPRLWDSVSNERGMRLNRWAKEINWKIFASPGKQLLQYTEAVTPTYVFARDKKYTIYTW